VPAARPARRRVSRPTGGHREGAERGQSAALAHGRFVRRDDRGPRAAHGRFGDGRARRSKAFLLGVVDLAKEKAKLEQQVEKLCAARSAASRRSSATRGFTAKAPPQVIAKERANLDGLRATARGRRAEPARTGGSIRGHSAPVNPFTRSAAIAMRSQCAAPPRERSKRVAQHHGPAGILDAHRVLVRWVELCEDCCAHGSGSVDDRPDHSTASPGVPQPRRRNAGALGV
jgi:hypothetical protein